jgi:hypothetical protein
MKRARPDGVITGLPHQATPGGMYYRADIAKEVFGIESEDDMQALVSDWNAFIAAAEKLTSETDFAMIYGADELKRNFMNTRDSAWVNANNELTICEDTIDEFVRVTKAIQDMDGGLRTNGTGQWAGNWNNDRQLMEGGVFAYFGSTWYLHHVHANNVGATRGQWGLIPGPAPFYWGGTYWFGSKAAAADDDKAAGVRAIIEFFCVEEESIAKWAGALGDFPANIAVAERFAANRPAGAQNNDMFLFGTNQFAVFAEIAKTIDITRNISRYDAQMDVLFGAFITDIFADGMDIDDAYEKLRESVKADLDSITVA